MSIRHEYEHSIGLRQPRGGRVTYQHAPSLPKPCVHPIITPAGTTLTGFEMSDHVWHRGLWFAIKFINGVNFWEEPTTAPFGTQRSLKEPTAAFDGGPDCVRVEHALNWASEPTGAVICESRTVAFEQRDDHAFVDWTTELEPLAALTLDRTPFTTWGGYSGLTFRGSRELHDANYLTPDGTTQPELIGVRHPWAVLQAKVDGGVDRRVSVGIVDHPSNPRSPTPFYGKSANGYAFFNAAFLFHEAMSLKAGERLKFRYRVIYRDGLWTRDAFAELADAFRRD